MRVSLILLFPTIASCCLGFNVAPSLATKAPPRNTRLKMVNFLERIFGSKTFDSPCIMGDESIMSPKAHGTSNTPVQSNLRWNCDFQTADRICNFNRHYAERRGYWTSTSFVEEARKEYEETGQVKFQDSNTGKLLFVAPKGRTLDEFLQESVSHGWPSFRDNEVVWDNVRCLKDGEAVSVDGTHLGHNLPDATGSRYCINLVSVAGRPSGDSDTAASVE